MCCYCASILFNGNANTPIKNIFKVFLDTFVLLDFVYIVIVYWDNYNIMASASNACVVSTYKCFNVIEI